MFRPNTAVAAEVKVKLMQYVQDFPQRTPVKGDRTLLIINMKSRHVTIVDEGTSNCTTYVLLDVKNKATVGFLCLGCAYVYVDGRLVLPRAEWCHFPPVPWTVI